MRTIRGHRHDRRGIGHRTGAGVALAATLLLGAPVAAQQPGPPRGQMDRAQIEQRIMAQFRSLVGTELGIDSVTSDVLFAVVGEMQEERRALQMRELRLDRRLRGTGVYLSEEQSGEALEEFIAIKREELRLLEAEHGRLGEVLSPPQLLRFYALRDEMGERIRRLRGGERGPRGAPSGQPFG
jgi:hypothetical protein